ncbi:hypothetical protein FOCC_FOCC008385 [Frankliniella occidentalis]|nr:hypothetical protein FOCC_FOCC008385 [Frankliniella occidentalis]
MLKFPTPFQISDSVYVLFCFWFGPVSTLADSCCLPYSKPPRAIEEGAVRSCLRRRHNLIDR